jgi:hypothetical protein
VLILRWYWWRINAWSEISSMLASFVISLICFKTVPGRWFPADDPRTDSVIMLITVAANTVIWVSVTFMTAPETDSILASFYERSPRRAGLGQSLHRPRLRPRSIPGGALAWTNWVAGIVAVYSTLFGIGKIVFGELGSGLMLLLLALIAFKLDRPIVPQRSAAAGDGGGRTRCRWRRTRNHLPSLHAARGILIIRGVCLAAGTTWPPLRRLQMSTMNQPEVMVPLPRRRH